MYTELFKLCGFEPEEIEKERPRIDKAFQKAEIEREDIERAESRVRQYFDTTSLGVKKSLRIWMEQLLDLVLAKEEGKKIVYPAYPTVPFLTVAMNLASEEVYCQTPEMVLDVVMGQIFGKLDPILEAAEVHGMPPGLAMCSLNQARVGGIVKGIIPIPDLLLGTGFFCDQTPKTDDFIHEVYGVPMVIMDGCMDSSWDEFPEISPRRIKALATELRRAVEESQELLGIKITEEVLEKSSADFVRLWTALFGLWEFLKADPMPISLTDLGPIWWAATTTERRGMREGFRAIAELTKEAKRRVDEGRGVVEKGAPRVLILCHQATDPRVMRMFEEAGFAVPTTALMGVTTSQATSYVETKYTTWEERVANILLSHGLYHSTSGLIHRYRELCKTWNLDGVLNFYHFSCRPYCITPLLIKKAIEEDPGIPVLSLEGDMWDTRDYSAEALKTRAETFAEMLRATKAAKVA
jgi:benzoyl-CoA reductase/2-hydroxyglutaryl-CoA dehydratase subunit BcrC/BadD/HgdB